MTICHHVRRLRDDGFTVFDGVIPPGEVDAVRGSVLETANQLFNPETKARFMVTHVSSFINHNQSFAPYLTDRHMMEVVRALFGSYFCVSFTTTQINDPGNPRTGWHADWPFNQNNAGHIPAPYPDFCIHLTTLWMLSPFNQENGGTLVVPGSHRAGTNPTTDMGVDPDQPYPSELLVTGDAGSVVMFDSRLWHAANHNASSEQRVSLAVRYAPWWLNLDVLRPGSVDRERIVEAAGANDNQVPPVTREVFDKLPSDVQALFRHWVE